MHVRFVQGRSRDAHLIVVGMPVFSAAWWKGRDFTAATLDAPLGSGPYKVKTFEQGRFIEYAPGSQLLGRPNCRSISVRTISTACASNIIASGRSPSRRSRPGRSTITRSTPRASGRRYDFPAVKDGRVKKETLHNGAPSTTQGWYLNTRRDQFKDPRVREAIGLCFDFDWTNKNIMYSAYKRIISYFPNTDMEAKGKPGPDELKLLEPFRDKLAPVRLRRPLRAAGKRRLGSDRKLLKQGLRPPHRGGLQARGFGDESADGKPLTIEFLDSNSALQPHTLPFIQNLGKLGIQATYRIVDPAQYKSRTDAFLAPGLGAHVRFWRSRGRRKRDGGPWGASKRPRQLTDFGVLREWLLDDCEVVEPEKDLFDHLSIARRMADLAGRGNR